MDITYNGTDVTLCELNIKNIQFGFLCCIKLGKVVKTIQLVSKLSFGACALMPL